jgi:hypothetical protein
MVNLTSDSFPHTLVHPDARPPADSLGLRWAALREAAYVVAQLAQVDMVAEAKPQLAFPSALRFADPRRQALIEQSMGDLVALMEPGLAALLLLHERGGDARPAARALWTEFVGSRQGLLALAPLL